MPEWMGSLCATRRPGEDVGCVLRDVLAVEDESRGRHGGERQVGSLIMSGMRLWRRCPSRPGQAVLETSCPRSRLGSVLAGRRSIKVHYFAKYFVAPGLPKFHESCVASAAAQISERISRKSDSRQGSGSADVLAELTMPTVESSSVASCSLELTMPIVESAAAGTPSAPPLA